MHIYICIHIYIIVCVCVCACVQLLAALIGVVLVSLLEMVNENHYEIADPSPGRILNIQLNVHYIQSIQ